MPFRIQRVDYFYTTVTDQPGQGYELLSQLAELGVNLLAFAAVPVGPTHTQLTLFPEESGRITTEAQRAGLTVEGPHPALLVQGDDKLGALAEIHQKLYAANVNVYSSNGVGDGKGGFGYVLYVRPDEYHRAAEALGV
jgi:hypothetical protein